MKILTDEKDKSSYTVPLDLHFLGTGIWVKFVTFL